MSASQTPEPGTERTLRSTVRNPRRRQRQSDGDSLKTAPRRKRSKLSENTFAARDTTEDTEELQDARPGAVMNGHPRGSTGGRGRGRKESTPMLDAELPMRGGRKPGTLKHRLLKGDGATVLAQNKVYSVKLLPSTPNELRKEGLEYRGSLLSTSSGHQHLALAVTREKAYVWDYSAHTAVSNARVFDIPFASRAGDALPFGASVQGAVSTDDGLVLVSATSGKIVFYESIERAALIGLFQERKTGVEGTISGFSSSETVIDVVSAEHAGFILTLSSGRIVQLTLRDGQGKARIFTQPLRPGDASSGLSGSIKSWYSGAWKRGVVAVRTRALDIRGQMQALSLTERCEMQIWDLDWSGRYEFGGSLDFRGALISELRGLVAPEAQGSVESLVALDFVISDKGMSSARGDEVATLSAQHWLQVWLLLRTRTPDMQDYHLAQLSLAGSSVNVERVMALQSYHGPPSTYQPRLCLPKPGHTAYVAFGDAVVLASATVPDVSDDPNAQLHEASYIQPQAFEDAVYLQSDKGLAVLDAVAEDTRSGHSSSVAFVKGAGLVRFTATDPSGDVERSRIPAKSKIEQTVFYGAMQDNILDFSRQGGVLYPTQEVEEAALAVSDEILRSDTPFIPASPSSVEAHLDYRAKALHALVTHVRRNHPPLSRTAMWQLLWDAEKVAAAQQMWKVFEEHKTSAQVANKDKRMATVIDELVTQMELHKGLAQAETATSDDQVRSVFVRGLARVDYLLSHIRNLLETLGGSAGVPPEKIVRWVAEADELWARAMQTAFTFRAEHAHLYGIRPELVEDGVLSEAAEYSDLPEFWTSTKAMLKASADIPKLSREFAMSYYEKEGAPSDLIKQITETNPELIRLSCLVFQERIKWNASRSSQKEQEFARALQQIYEQHRYDQFRSLASIGSASQGMKLAEKYRDMQTLTELVVGESQYYVDELQNNPNMSADERALCVDLMSQMTERIGKYFNKFGDDWANAFFDEAFSESCAGNMLDEAQKNWKQALTRYLRADSSRAKICWINDVTAVADYRHAGEVLCDAATEAETKVWAKKVELGMSKLALLAAQGDATQRFSGLEAAISKPEMELKVLGVQEKLYDHVRAECKGALDDQAELQLAMDTFGTRVDSFTSLRQLLEVNVEQLLSHQALSVEELIDVSTLMDSFMHDHAAGTPDANLQGTEFSLALQTLDAVACEMPQERFETLLKLIWKRCYIYDDWTAITSAEVQKGNTDSDVQTMLRETASWRTFFNLHDATFFAGPDCSIRVLEPSECLDAACMPEDLAYRFPNRDLLDPILQDNRLQDEVLQGYVADRALDDWVQSCLADARNAVKEQAERVAGFRQREREVQRRAEEKEAKSKAAKKKGRNGVGKANGHVNGVRRMGNGVPGTSVDGDIEMG